MFFGIKKPLFVTGLFVIALVLPLTVILLQKQQDTRSRADVSIISIWPSSATPVTASDNDTRAVELGVKFQTAIPGKITGIRFYKGRLNTGTHIGNLWSASGTRLATAAFTSETTSGWQQVNFTTPVDVEPNTTYIASYFAPRGAFALNKSYFSNAVVNGPLKALSNAESGGNGVYKYGASSGFPTDSYIASNYWVDVLFLSSVEITGGAETELVCKEVPADISVVIDRSGSMAEKTSAGAGATKIAGAKIAGVNFINILAENTQNRADLVTYSGSSRLDVPFTNNFSSLTSAINSISANGGTCIECGIKQANEDIQSRGRPGFKKVIVLLTDGRANFIYGSSYEKSTALAEQRALEAALAGRAANGTIIFTIGLGNDVNADFLEQIATQTGGKYYFPPTPEALNDIYAEISQIIAQGSVSGIIFHDANENKKLDSGEQKLSGWKVNAVSGSSTLSAISDSRGNYFIAGFCDGSYTVKPEIKSGWVQTLPSGGIGYNISIVNGNAIIGKDFGVAVAKPTPKPSVTAVPKDTELELEVFLHNIGNSGDNANPAFSLSNKKPLHPVRDAVVALYDANNNVVSTTSGSIKYASASGSFKGVFVLDRSVRTGAYRIKVTTREHLTKLIPGIQAITAAEVNTLPSTHHVATDNNNDNKLNILDYNMLLDCYSDTLPAPACTTQKKLDTDPNDDGNVNQYDYNLFVREISVQAGD